MRRLTLPLSSALTLGALACAAPIEDGDRCVSAVASGLVGGATDPAAFQLDEARANAVARLRLVLAPGTIEFDCSAVVIGPRLAVSAAHCTLGREVLGGTLAIGARADEQAELLPVTRVERHPELDLLAIELGVAVRGARSAIRALPLLALPEDASRLLAGEVLLAGYGQDERGRLGERAFLSEPVYDVSSLSVTVDGAGASGACLGDSGGPLLTRADDGELVAIGVLSRGEPSCTGLDEYVRLDAALSWLRARGASVHEVAPDRACE